MLDRMSRGDQIAAGGALALVISLFLPWYGIDFGGQLGNDAFAKLIEQEASGLSAFKAFEVIDIVLLLIGVAVAAVVFLMANGNLDGSLRRIIETAGSFAALAVVFRMVDQPDPSQFVKLRYGIVIGLLAAVAISFGGMLNRREGI